MRDLSYLESYTVDLYRDLVESGELSEPVIERSQWGTAIRFRGDDRYEIRIEYDSDGTFAHTILGVSEGVSLPSKYNGRHDLLEAIGEDGGWRAIPLAFNSIGYKEQIRLGKELFLAALPILKTIEENPPETLR